MKPNSDSNFSLYDLTKNSELAPDYIGLTPQTLLSCVQTFNDVLLTQSTNATFFLYSPESQNWHSLVKKQQANSQLKALYICQSSLDAVEQLMETNELVDDYSAPIFVDITAEFKRECFLLVLAPEFCGLVLAQWQKGQITMDGSGKRLQQPYLETIISFDSLLIKPFTEQLLELINRNNPSLGDLKIDDFHFAESTPLTTKFLTNFLTAKISKENQLNIALANRTSGHPSNQNFSLASNLGLQADFLHNLVTEMQSPVTHMKTAISLLGSKQIKGEQRQLYLQMLETQCDRQNSVINGLLELLKLDLPTEVENINLSGLVPGIVSTYQPLANENNIQLGYTIPIELPPVIFPKIWLRQIIIQLLNNSLQFTPPQGRVFVQATSRNRQVELTIGDTGRGIENQELSKIFDSFYRTKTASNDQTKGAGLGLTIVRQLVEKSGGKIAVSSKLGKGSVFKILLPTLPPELM